MTDQIMKPVLFFPCPKGSSRYFSQVPFAYVRFDLRCLDLPQNLLDLYQESIQKAMQSMKDLEHGSLANPDEGRQVGHYWLRNPDCIDDPLLQTSIRENVDRIVSFASQIRNGNITASARSFQNVLLIGIGGSALGPQFLSSALHNPSDRIKPFFIDNTDPDGIHRVFSSIQETKAGLAGTLVIVASKSGATKETRNGQLEAKAQFEKSGLHFKDHAVAITMKDSQLDKQAIQEGWLARFPMWDFIGGRTSLFSAVGLLPAALYGFDVRALLAGAKDMDEWTRHPDPSNNPAMQLAVSWHFLTQKGRREMVVLPYKDRLDLFSKYLQQLVMESLGKEKDLQGRQVHEGIVVYGNKGSTDQHAYIQQLRDGVDRFFVSLIQVQKDQEASDPLTYVEENVTSGDYLLGFLLGTQQALFAKKRPSFTITIPEVSEYTIGMLVALYERVVGYYAFLVNINAYHQPGVEAGKTAALAILGIQQDLWNALSFQPMSADELCQRCSLLGQEDVAFQILEHLSINRRIVRDLPDDQSPRCAKYSKLPIF